MMARMHTTYDLHAEGTEGGAEDGTAEGSAEGVICKLSVYYKIVV